MNNITAHNESSSKIFSVSEFMDFGERYGIDYRFPMLMQKPDFPHSSPVLQGEVEEMTLPCGMCVTHSDVQVLQPYETTSRHSSPLYMLVVLEGCVVLTLNGQKHVVRSGMAFSSRLSERQTMCASHHADCKLRTLSLGLYSDGAWRDGLLASLMREWERCQTPTLIWQVPGFLLSGLQYARQGTLSSVSRQLMLEGLILQLFGHGLSVCQVESGKRLGGEQQRLERIRCLLEQEPEKNHTLNELAQRAAMSPSSLRSKFRAAYGCSVFDYLRDCRLERARSYLLAGYSVQQAAWMSGYQHATNFSTAFRRRYGFPPGDVHKLC
ncbi:AraC family transcriptional regulator [Citrobacter amalonaticus]|uniref:AraC family transcriptional regulator n=1 Tax=Citrobacter amalonaticus TaxID=35703 RepID=A0A2S4S0V9_CITAM|nr:AraC family transcriptional regulator [Citrobacter amalonaticus]POT58507.1 AraC family transcriptional regulator [Citrobacter amalonaticus]POT75968.1 AraC family transcriptional regulator [Citrobacter amalonaticus]POU67034.1 AraC family transcriptional regulator [Citrobacter amalonaticus]POV05203.1 AraC family transcriptional regulator [Citrobacter amalonaticus]